MNINFTKKPMKPIKIKPMAVFEVILLNSARHHSEQTLKQVRTHRHTVKAQTERCTRAFQ